MNALRPRLLLVSVLALLAAAIGGSGIAAEDGDAPSFPVSWVGTYRGDLRISSPGKEPMSVRTEIRIAALEAEGRWTFEIGYEGQPQRRYELISVDPAAGRWLIDEKNSIRLPAILIDCELISEFAVSGNRITTRYRMADEGIEFDLLTTSAEAVEASGGSGGAPQVHSFAVRNRQRGLLSRVEGE